MPLSDWARTRRGRYLANRKRRGLERPKPLRGVVVNCMSVSTGPVHAAQILDNASQIPGVDLILGSECADFDAKFLLGDEWQVFQPGATGSPESGCLIAARRSRGRLSDCESEVASTAGDGLRERSVLSALLAVDRGTEHAAAYRVKAGHPPPKRAWAKWPGYMRHMTGADIAGADFNKLARAVAPFLRRRTRMVHILGFAVRWWIPTTRARGVGVGGDHEAVVCTFWPDRR